jgi:hypothetical protein
MSDSPNNGRLAVEQRLTRIETRLDAVVNIIESTATYDSEAHHDIADKLGRIEDCINRLKIREAEQRGEMKAYKKVAGFISAIVAAIITGVVMWLERFFK